MSTRARMLKAGVAGFGLALAAVTAAGAATIEGTGRSDRLIGTVQTT